MKRIFTALVILTLTFNSFADVTVTAADAGEGVQIDQRMGGHGHGRQTIRTAPLGCQESRRQGVSDTMITVSPASSRQLPVVTVRRGSQVESWHHAQVAVADPAGNLLARVMVGSQVTCM